MYTLRKVLNDLSVVQVVTGRVRAIIIALGTAGNKPQRASAFREFLHVQCLAPGVLQQRTTVTWAKRLLPFTIGCHFIVTQYRPNSRTIRSQVSQTASAGKETDMSELKGHIRTE